MRTNRAARGGMLMLLAVLVAACAAAPAALAAEPGADASRDEGIALPVLDRQMSDVTVAPIADQAYTGEAVTPVLTVSYLGEELTEGSDYTVSFSDNVQVGTATATLQGAGRYDGTLMVTFAIVSTTDDYVEGELIVVFDDDDSVGLSALSLDATWARLEDVGVQVEEVLSEGTDDVGAMVLASIDADVDVQEAVEAAEAVAGVAYAQPNYVYTLLEDAVTDDPAVSSSFTYYQYYLYGDELDTTGYVGADVVDAWDYATCEDVEVTVVIMDTGVNLTHEDLQDNVLSEYCYDFHNNKALEASGSYNGDYYGHGTHVAGIVAGIANNGLGIAGVSYNANIIAYKVFDDSATSPSASTATLVSAYEGMLTLMERHPELNIRVANVSMGTYELEDVGPDQAVHDVIAQAREAGVLTVCAGGNGDGSTPCTDNLYPADWDECMAVTALQADGENLVWSDFNEEKDISAPGAKLYSTYNSSSSSYARMSGTSMAAPVVSGVAALLFAADEDATVDEVVEAITSTATEVDDTDDAYSRNSTGYEGVVSGSAGAVNAEAAVMELLGVEGEDADDAGSTDDGTDGDDTGADDGTTDDGSDDADADDGSDDVDGADGDADDGADEESDDGTDDGTTDDDSGDVDDGSGDADAGDGGTDDDAADDGSDDADDGGEAGDDDEADDGGDDVEEGEDDATAFSFPDVQDPSRYYYDSVYQVAEAGILTGYDNGYFGVGDALSRKQLAVIMWRIACPDEAASYEASGYESTTDPGAVSGIADGAYWSAAADWAVAAGVINGKEASDGSRYFDADGTVTFEQLCAVLANYCDAEGRDAADASVVDAFVDAVQVGSWACLSLAWAVSVGVVHGTDDGRLMPKAAVVRERAAVVFANALAEGLL